MVRLHRWSRYHWERAFREVERRLMESSRRPDTSSYEMFILDVRGRTSDCWLRGHGIWSPPRGIREQAARRDSGRLATASKRRRRTV